MSELSRARRIVDRAECMAHGHSYDVVAVLGRHTPEMVICTRDCGFGPWPIQSGTCTSEFGGQRCARPLGHSDSHSLDRVPDYGSFIWSST